MACLWKNQKVLQKQKRLESPSLMPCFPSLCRVDEGDAVIMHPGFLCIMVRLLPRLYHEDQPQVLVDEHIYLFFSHDWLSKLLPAGDSFSLCTRYHASAELPPPAGECQCVWDPWLSSSHLSKAVYNRSLPLVKWPEINSQTETN